MHSELNQRIVERLSQLPLAQRLVVELKVFQSMTFEEIADMQDISENTAKLLLRCTQELRKPRRTSMSCPKTVYLLQEYFLICFQRRRAQSSTYTSLSVESVAPNWTPCCLPGRNCCHGRSSACPIGIGGLNCSSANMLPSRQRRVGLCAGNGRLPPLHSPCCVCCC